MSIASDVPDGLEGDVLAAALMERPIEQTPLPEPKKRSRKNATTEVKKPCAKCGKRPQKRCEFQLCAKCCVAESHHCTVHLRRGEAKRGAAPPPKSSTVRDLRQVHAMYQQEAEESRLWFKWVYEKNETEKSGQLYEALDRYAKNAEWLGEIMDGTSTEETCTDLVATLEGLEKASTKLVAEYSISDKEGVKDDNDDDESKRMSSDEDEAKQGYPDLGTPDVVMDDQEDMEEDVDDLKDQSDQVDQDNSEGACEKIDVECEESQTEELFQKFLETKSNVVKVEISSEERRMLQDISRHQPTIQL